MQLHGLFIHHAGTTLASMASANVLSFKDGIDLYVSMGLQIEGQQQL